MEKKKMRMVILILLASSIAIYGLQILIFRDAKTTAFYIFQDFAFMPATIAIATLVVGELIDEQEKRTRMDKTRMLTSTFFTEIGTKLVMELVHVSEPKMELNTLMAMQCQSESDLKAQKDKINELNIRVKLDSTAYAKITDMLKGAQTALMVLSSNPLLFEHEDFTDLLWALFHLVDEYNLRGAYENLKKSDIEHLNTDYGEMLRLLMINYVSNAKYVRETYPNLYRTAKAKIQEAVNLEEI